MPITTRETPARPSQVSPSTDKTTPTTDELAPARRQFLELFKVWDSVDSRVQEGFFEAIRLLQEEPEAEDEGPNFGVGYVMYCIWKDLPPGAKSMARVWVASGCPCRRPQLEEPEITEVLQPFRAEAFAANHYARQAFLDLSLSHSHRD